MTQEWLGKFLEMTFDFLVLEKIPVCNLVYDHNFRNAIKLIFSKSGCIKKPIEAKGNVHLLWFMAFLHQKLPSSHWTLYCATIIFFWVLSKKETTVRIFNADANKKSLMQKFNHMHVLFHEFGKVYDLPLLTW